MAPLHRTLTPLAVRKARLRHEIAEQRARCHTAAIRVLQPLHWLDRLAAGWTRFAPAARWGFGLWGSFLTRRRAFRRGRLGALVRWVPLVWVVIRLVRPRPQGR